MGQERSPRDAAAIAAAGTEKTHENAEFVAAFRSKKSHVCKNDWPPNSLKHKSYVKLILAFASSAS